MVKKIILSVMLILGVMFATSGVIATGCSSIGEATIWSLKLNGVDQVTVAPSETITASVRAQSDCDDTWESTKYKIEGGSWICVNTADHAGGTYTENFLITAPSNPGVYDFSVRVYENENCDNDEDSKTLNDGIIVVEESPCNDCEVNIVNPLEGQYYSTAQGDVLIDWTAEDCDTTLYSILYGEVEQSCDELDNEDWTSLGTTQPQTQFPWDVSSIGEGKFCVKVENNGCCEIDKEGPFIIDNKDPVVNTSREICTCEGQPCVSSDCRDGCSCEPFCEYSSVYTCDEGSSVVLDGSNSYDPGQFPSGIASYEWIVDGENVYSGPLSTFEYECLDGDVTLSVVLKVTDNVENEGTGTATIVEKNVAPVCNGIKGPFEVPLIDEQAEATFTGSASDASDIDEAYPLVFNWAFGDGDSDSGNPSVTHTYTSAGTYQVTLSVEDKDEGVSENCVHTIKVIKPILLGNQEAAAYYPLIADFGNNGTARSFYTGLTNLDSSDCQVYDGPTNLRTRANVDAQDACIVRWDNDNPSIDGLSENPTNDEQGIHGVVIRVDNGTDVKYFAFDITVYSWIIDLNEGWNLVSIPYVPADSSIDASGIGISNIKDELNSIWSYEYDKDSDSSSWKCKKTTSSGGWSSSYCSGTDTKLNDIVPGRGYWLKMDEPAKLKGFGTQIGQNGVPGMPPEIDVPTNSWSLIGRYGILGSEGNYHYPGQTCWDAGGISVWKALESLNKLDNELHVFDVDEEAHLIDVNKLFNNEGYWLWIEDEKFNNAGFESYAPLDKYYREDLMCMILQ